MGGITTTYRFMPMTGGVITGQDGAVLDLDEVAEMAGEPGVQTPDEAGEATEDTQAELERLYSQGRAVSVPLHRAALQALLEERNIGNRWERLGDDSILPVLSGRETADVVKYLFRTAKRNILIGTSTLRESPLVDALIEKLNQGVAVSIIVADPVSQLKGKDKAASAMRAFDRLREAGAKVYSYPNERLQRSSSQSIPQYHRKMIVIDDETAFISNCNISTYPENFDLGVLLQGPSVSEVLRVFYNDWYASTGEIVKVNPVEKPNPDIRIVNEENFYLMLLRLIDKADRSITLAYYLAAHPDVAEALAKKRLKDPNVQIRVMAGPPITTMHVLGIDLKIPRNAAFVQQLAKAGIDVKWGKIPDEGWMHAKVAIVDGKTALVGNTDLTKRGLQGNLETNVLISNSGLPATFEMSTLQYFETSGLPAPYSPLLGLFAMLWNGAEDLIINMNRFRYFLGNVLESIRYRSYQRVLGRLAIGKFYSTSQGASDSPIMTYEAAEQALRLAAGERGVGGIELVNHVSRSSVADGISERSSSPVDLPIEVWDGAIKISERLGKNPGGVYEVSIGGVKHKYYVKFTLWPDSDRIWNEVLADVIYRILDVPVPETKVVRINGQLARASLIVEGRHGSAEEVRKTSSWNMGFVADALLANWDITGTLYKNVIIGHDGNVYRLDNGGALLYRARGKRKGAGAFSETVLELGRNRNRRKMFLGMRQDYPKLTDADIGAQVETLRQKFTDDTIDLAVNKTGLPDRDRQYIRRILKARRDYIIGKYSGIGSTTISPTSNPFSMVLYGGYHARKAEQIIQSPVIPISSNGEHGRGLYLATHPQSAIDYGAYRSAQKGQNGQDIHVLLFGFKGKRFFHLRQQGSKYMTWLKERHPNVIWAEKYYWLQEFCEEMGYDGVMLDNYEGEGRHYVIIYNTDLVERGGHYIVRSVF